MKGLSLNRNKIEDVLNENLSDKYTISKESKPNGLIVYKFIGTGIKPASLNIYFINGGTTTLHYKIGANQELSFDIASLIKEKCSIKEFKSNSFYLKAIRKVDFETILEFLVEDQNIILSDVIEKNGRKVKVEGFQGDEVTLFHYTNDAFMIQGKPRMLFNDIVVLLSEMMPFKDIIEKQLEFYETNLTATDIIGELENRLPISGKYLEDKIKIVFSPSLAVSKIIIELDDYSFFAFPALRGLEGVLKQIFKENGIVISSKDGFGDYIHNRGGINTVLSDLSKEKIKCQKTENAICEIYSFYNSQRHSLFHMEGTVINSRILTFQEATHLINFTINLIESSFDSMKN